MLESLSLALSGVTCALPVWRRWWTALREAEMKLGLICLSAVSGQSFPSL